MLFDYYHYFRRIARFERVRYAIDADFSMAIFRH